MFKNVLLLVKMDNTEDYATMNSSYQTVYNNKSEYFFNYDELENGVYLKKDEVDTNNEIMKQIRNNTQTNNRQIDNTQNNTQTNNTTQNNNTCPICNQQSISTCSCFKRDSICVNKHKWYYGQNDVKILGHSH